MWDTYFTFISGFESAWKDLKKRSDLKEKGVLVTFKILNWDLVSLFLLYSYFTPKISLLTLI